MIENTALAKITHRHFALPEALFGPEIGIFRGSKADFFCSIRSDAPSAPKDGGRLFLHTAANAT